jgi:hypothetical protein
MQAREVRSLNALNRLERAAHENPAVTLQAQCRDTVAEEIEFDRPDRAVTGAICIEPNDITRKLSVPRAKQPRDQNFPIRLYRQRLHRTIGVEGSNSVPRIETCIEAAVGIQARNARPAHPIGESKRSPNYQLSVWLPNDHLHLP